MILKPCLYLVCFRRGSRRLRVAQERHGSIRWLQVTHRHLQLLLFVQRATGHLPRRLRRRVVLHRHSLSAIHKKHDGLSWQKWSNAQWFSACKECCQCAHFLLERNWGAELHIGWGPKESSDQAVRGRGGRGLRSRDGHEGSHHGGLHSWTEANLCRRNYGWLRGEQGGGKTAWCPDQGLARHHQGPRVTKATQTSVTYTER